MKILEYYESQNRKKPGDPAMVLAQNEVELRIKEMELLQKIKNEYNLDFSTSEVKITDSRAGKKSFEELQRLRKVRSKNMEKIKKIEKLLSNFSDICSESEYENLRSTSNALNLKLQAEGDFLSVKIIKRYPSQGADYILRGREIVGSDSNLPSEAILRVGVMAESQKCKKLQAQIDNYNKQIAGFEANKKQILDFVNKICGEDKNE